MTTTRLIARIVNNINQAEMTGDPYAFMEARRLLLNDLPDAIEEVRNGNHGVLEMEKPARSRQIVQGNRQDAGSVGKVHPRADKVFEI
jgi:hypothetical protein